MRKSKIFILGIVLLLMFGIVLFKKYSGHDSNIFKENTKPVISSDVSELTLKNPLEKIQHEEDDLVPDVASNEGDNLITESQADTAIDPNITLDKKQFKRIRLTGKKKFDMHQEIFDLQEISEWSSENEETLSSTLLPMLEKYQMFEDSLDIECKESICKAIVFHESFKSKRANFSTDLHRKLRDSESSLFSIFGTFEARVIDGSPGLEVFLFTHGHDREKYEQYYLREVPK